MIGYRSSPEGCCADLKLNTRHYIRDKTVSKEKRKIKAQATMPIGIMGKKRLNAGEPNSLAWLV